MKKPKLRELKEAVRAVFSGRYTTRYPAVAHEPPEGFRGKPEFSEDDCIGCAACAEVCPAVAITVVDDDRSDPPKRTLELHYDKCIFCGQCELNCTTETGVHLTKTFDLAATDRSSMVDRCEHDLVLCEVCGAVVGTLRHLQWVARRLGAKAYANPTLIVSADGGMRLANPVGERKGEPALPRSDMMRILCPACRRTTVIREIWGQ